MKIFESNDLKLYYSFVDVDFEENQSYDRVHLSIFQVGFYQFESNVFDDEMIHDKFDEILFVLN